MDKQKLIYSRGWLILILTIMGIFGYIYYLQDYMGDYIIQEQWINSSYEGKYYCDNCLWIKFYEGCNRYPVYYFENQHEFDDRFSFGDVVNINFKDGYVNGITLARKYRSKC